MDDVDPGLRLVIGGMFGYPNNDKAIKMRVFLKRLYSIRGIRGIIDGVSLHPYSGNLRGVKKQIKDARQVMDRAGDGNADLWIGEIGWASGGKRNELVKSPGKQAKLLDQAYKMLLQKRRSWNVRAAFWYIWRDFPPDGGCPWCPQAGLLTKQGKEKPSWTTYKALIRSRG